MEFNWDWAIFFKALTSALFLKGVWVSIWVAVVSQVCGVALGTLFALMRLSRSCLLRPIAGLYDWIFRGTPMLVQILFFFAVLPQIGPTFGILESGLIALALNEGARMAEIIRAGIISIEPGQIEAAQSLGLNRYQIFTRIIYRQAVRVIIPPLGNDFTNLLKATSLLAVVGIVELLRTAQQYAQATTRPLEVYIAASMYYLVLISVWDKIQKLIEKKVSYPAGIA